MSDEAAFVITGMIPIDLLAMEAKHISTLKSSVDIDRVKSDARKRSITEWQTRWSTSTKGRWTYELIQRVDTWFERGHGYLNFYLTQFLSGHGCFRSYLYRFKRDSSPFCPHCIDVVEDPKHVFFICPRFSSERADLERKVGSSVCPSNIVQIMLISLRNWEVVCDFVKLVLVELRRQEEIRRRI